MNVAVLAAAVVFAAVVRGPGPFVGLSQCWRWCSSPLERRMPLRRQRTLRAGFATDLAHLLVNNEMDWLASGRLHPLDSAFTQALSIAPLLVLGYGPGTLGGAAVAFVVLALFPACGTAYLPRDERPSGFGTNEPVPHNSYRHQLAYPFTAAR